MANVFGCEAVKDFKEYERFEEFRLPWGNCINMSGGAYTEFQRSLMNEINFIRNSSVPLTKEQVADNMPVQVNDEVYKFIMNHIHNVRLINLGEVRKVHPGYLGDGEYATEYESDTPYGLTNVVFYFLYNTALRRFEPVFNGYALNSNIPEQNAIRRLSTLCPSFYGESHSDRLKAFDFLLDNCCLSNLEFFPVYVSTNDGVVVSHRQYKTKWGVEHEVTSPTLGVNILNHPEVMEALSDWTKSGGKINPRNTYLILASRDDRSKYYLKSYVE